MAAESRPEPVSSDDARHADLAGSRSVSVVIPTFNRGDWCAAAVESALGQTLPPHEVIVVDDGSSEPIEAALAPWRERIRYVRQANAGQAAARNHGSRLATGDWLAFLDSDDRWQPPRLARLLERGANEIAAGRASAITSASAVCDGRGRPTGRVLGTRRGQLSTEELLDRHKGLINGASVLVPRRLFAEIGRFDETLNTAEDCDLWLRLSRHGPILFVDEPLLLYRRHDANISHVRALDDARNWLRILAKLEREAPDLVHAHPDAFRRSLASQNRRLAKHLMTRRMPGDLAEASARLQSSLRAVPFSQRTWRYLARAGLLRLMPARRR
jgi:glycosyltransferase involved in cell wall biosynthesis